MTMLITLLACFGVYILFSIMNSIVHNMKIDYLISNGYEVQTTDVGYKGKQEIYFEKENICLTEDDIKELSYNELKENY